MPYVPWQKKFGVPILCGVIAAVLVTFVCEVQRDRKADLIDDGLQVPGKVVSVTTVGEEAAEALEIVALETSELVGKPLREAGLQGAVVGAIVRGDDVIIPSGEDRIEVGDHVVLFALRSAIPKLETQMMVKLQYF